MASTINASTTSTTGLVYTADGTGILQLQSDGTTGLTVGAGGNVTVNTNLFVSGSEVEPLVLGTAQATTSGTVINFTGIPSWVKRITVMFNGVSTNGTSQILVQVGANVSYTTSGYSSVGFGYASTPSFAGSNSTVGFIFQDGMAAFVVVSGAMSITHFGNNNWVYTATVSRGAGATNYAGIGSGTVILPGTLDRLRVTTVNGTDTFDAGSVNIMYE